MSDFGTRGPGLIPGVGAYYKNNFFFFFSLVMQNYLIEVIWNYINDKKLQYLTFYIELSSKFVGVGLNLALPKDN